MANDLNSFMIQESLIQDWKHDVLAQKMELLYEIRNAASDRNLRLGLEDGGLRKISRRRKVGLNLRRKVGSPTPSHLLTDPGLLRHLTYKY